MSKVWLIIQREYWTRVRKKSFIVTTLLAPLGFAAFFIVMIFLAKGSDTERKIAVIDEEGFFTNRFEDTRNIHFKFSDEGLELLKETYVAEGYDGILYIPKLVNISSPRGIQYLSESQLGIGAKQHIEAQISKVIRNKKIDDAGLDKKTLDQIDQVDIQLETITLGEEGEKTVNTEVAMGLGYMMGFAIYMVLLIYGTMVMRGVVEEKTNKIVEVMVSSVKPFQLMLGKIIGVGAVGLTQFVLWGILGGGLLVLLSFIFQDEIQAMEQMNSQAQMYGPGQDPEEMAMQMAEMYQGLKSLPLTAIFLQFVYYFFGGYLLYGALFAAIGSASNEEGDGQSLNFIVSIPIIISIVIMTSVVQEPNSSLAIWSSIFPFTSPVVMPARLAFEPTWWERALSMLMLIGGFLFTTWLAGRIYRTGILLYGKKVTLKDIAKWVKG